MADPATTNIFFSYSRSDSAFVLKLATALRGNGRHVWVDQLDIPKGARWDDEVEKALKASGCLLVVLSPTSTASENVMDEVSFALDQKKTVIPILIQPCEVPFRLKRLQYIDFTADHDEAYRQLGMALDALGGRSAAAVPGPTAVAPAAAPAPVSAPVDAPTPAPPAKRGAPWLAIGAVVLACAAGGGYLAWSKPGAAPAQVADRTSQPTEPLLRRAIDSLAEGKCPDVFGPQLAAGCEQKNTGPRFGALGAFKSLKFRGKEQGQLGPVDVYVSEHEHGQMVWNVAATPNGKFNVFRYYRADQGPSLSAR